VSASGATAHPAIATYALRRDFKDRGQVVTALDGVDLAVELGELFGLLGPNGAGKTTLIKILTTLLLPSSGRAEVDGVDVVRNPGEVRWRINAVAGGEASGYGLLTVRENLWLWAQMYGVGYRLTEQRIDHLLRVVGLGEKGTTKSNQLSTGMRQKMNFARGFLSDPKVLFLDEPTLGLDINAALDVRAYISAWARGEAERLPGAAPGPRTVLLTTHYLHEADELCDRVAIIHRGQVLACDTPANLKRLAQQESVFTLVVEGPREGWDRLRSVRGVQQLGVSHADGRVELRLALEDDAAIAQVIASLPERGARLISLSKEEPSLEDAFIRLTGTRLEMADARTTAG
jgi:ABC-2 type transport system ATP-binding protein